MNYARSFVSVFLFPLSFAIPISSNAVNTNNDVPLFPGGGRKMSGIKKSNPGHCFSSLFGIPGEGKCPGLDFDPGCLGGVGFRSFYILI